MFSEELVLNNLIEKIDLVFIKYLENKVDSK